MNIVQKIILVIGTVLTIYILTFAPLNKRVFIHNPDFDPSRPVGGFANRQYFSRQEPDYSKKILFAFSAIAGTSVLVFITKGEK